VRRTSGLVAAGALALIIMTAAAACSDDDKKSSPSTSTSVLTIGTCKIQPGTSCPSANLAGANLTAANLTGADLAAANLSGANLTNANLSGANLTSANLSEATLASTNLSAANLTKANFTGAKLTNVNLADATRCDTIRTNGTIDNASCPPPAQATTTSTTNAAGTSTTGETPAHPNCTSTALAAALDSQGGYYGLSEQELKQLQAIGNPSCATSYATQMFGGAPLGPGELKAVFSAAPNNGWHLLGINGCQPAMNVPPTQAVGIC
jgi:uncharacterized protein YjbI with pentapeptide repeats